MQQVITLIKLIRVEPLNASMILNIAKVIVDFPAPVLPTTPIFSYGFIRAVIPLTTHERFDRYLRWMLLNSISPYLGHWRRGSSEQSFNLNLFNLKLFRFFKYAYYPFSLSILLFVHVHMGIVGMCCFKVLCVGITSFERHHFLFDTAQADD